MPDPNRGTPEPTDESLLKAHVDGDPYAFGELFRRHRDRLWAVALRTAGNPEEAADALQDAMLSACRRAGTFRGDSAVTTWLHRIVVNACLDRLRRAAARPTTELTEPVLADAAPAVVVDPVEAEELRLTLAGALAKLPYDQRAALVLVDMEGYPVEEAAQLLGVPVGTVKSRCARGRARLLPLVAHLRGGEPAGGRGNAMGVPSVQSRAQSGPGRSPTTGARREGGDQR